MPKHRCSPKNAKLSPNTDWLDCMGSGQDTSYVSQMFTDRDIQVGRVGRLSPSDLGAWRCDVLRGHTLRRRHSCAAAIRGESVTNSVSILVEE